MGTRKCKGCKQMRVRVQGRRRAKSRHHHYLDEHGGFWDRNYCPSCSTSPAFEANPLTGKRCRTCQAPLHADRYFNCTACIAPAANGESMNHSTWTPEYWNER